MEINKARFYNITYNNTFDIHERYNIGTYKEKKLHIILKKYFEEDETYHEIKTNGFIADIRRDRVITEIETSGFSGLGPKLSAYLSDYTVNLVYPIAHKKYVSWIDPETSTISNRRHSPKKMNAYDALFEMVRILPYINDPNLCILVPLLELDEYRLLDGWSYDKKRGSHRYERIPTDLIDIIEFRADEDFIKYIPESLPASFTLNEFSKSCKIDSRVARAVIKVFETRGLISYSGKRGRAHVYSKNY